MPTRSVLFMEVQQQVYLQHALNAFDTGAVAEAIAYVSHLQGALAPNVWALVAERLANARVHERFRVAWCARIVDVPEAQRLCAAARFLHMLWRVPLMQVQGRSLACPACRIRAEEHALEPRCDACRRIDAAFATCATCGYRHGPLCISCDAAHPVGVPCMNVATPSALTMGEGMYMPVYLRAALRPQAVQRTFKRRPQRRPGSAPLPEMREEAPAVSLSSSDGPAPSRISLILSRADPARMFVHPARPANTQ